MRIDDYEALERWDFRWPTQGDGPWRLRAEQIELAFGQNKGAIGVYWIGYAPQSNHGSFQAKYCGKAVRQPLYRRLLQHARSSSNATIRSNVSSPGAPALYFRYVELPELRLAEVLEGLEIAAFSDVFWNQRNEWVQHWAMEDDYPRR
jgi:hypothetical protein